jgi:hypothetical protein
VHSKGRSRPAGIGSCSAKDPYHPFKWLVIAILDVLLLATIAMVHVERPRTALINMFALSTGIAACLALLMVHDRPFSAGGFTLEPAALREIAVAD